MSAQREMNVNMVTCGGQATIPMVAAVSRVQPVEYAEIVATVASKSVGPGTRKNIDEFTRTTASAVEKVGGAQQGKAIIIINPAEPPLIMRDTIHCLTEGEPEQARSSSIGPRDDQRSAEICARLPLEERPGVRRQPGDRSSWRSRARRLPAEIRRQPRHHDRGGAAHRRDVRRGNARGPPETRTCARAEEYHESQGNKSHRCTTCACATACIPSVTRSRIEQMQTIATALDEAGVPLIEVTHGDGLGGASVNYGFPAAPTKNTCARVIPLLKNAKVSALLLPGIGTVDHLRMAQDCGVTTIRVATHCTEADVSEQHIALGRKLGMDTVGFLMMAHMIEPEADCSSRPSSWNPTAPTACTAPTRPATCCRMMSRARIAPAARRAQTRNRDRLPRPPQPGDGRCQFARRGRGRRRRVSTRSAAGLGAGAGNTPMEVFVAVCDRMGIETGVDLFKIMDVAEDLVVPIMDHPVRIDRDSLTLGYAGVYSSFLLFAKRAGSQVRRLGTRNPGRARPSQDGRRPGRHDRGHRDHDGARTRHQATRPGISDVETKS